MNDLRPRDIRAVIALLILLAALAWGYREAHPAHASHTVTVQEYR